MNFATSVQNLVTNAVAQNVTAKSRQTTGTVQAQATALVAGKPIMPTQAMPGTPIVLGQLSKYNVLLHNTTDQSVIIQTILQIGITENKYESPLKISTNYIDILWTFFVKNHKFSETSFVIG